MKRSIYYVIFMALALALPQLAKAQANLSGIWRFRESKKIKGPSYSNAMPLVLTIKQTPNIIALEMIYDIGGLDTIVKESLNYGEKVINESLTAKGKKKIVSFKMNADNSWLKQTDILTEKDSTKVQSVNKETFTLYPDGIMLGLFRDYNGNDDPAGNQDFTIDGTYEKVTPEQLAQETARGKGVDFVENLNWDQIKAKAKKENKYIFVDCYATWCMPCKMMDKYIYPLNIVGEAMNSQFIAVKVQLDSTKKDPASIKLLYPLARQLEKEYGISALPSYLFFSPDGTAVHKAMGQRNAKKFIALLANSRKPEQQLYTFVNKVKNKEFPYSEYPALAKKLNQEFREKELAKEVARIYYQEYLDKLSEKELLTKSNLDFIGEYYRMLKSSDKIFRISRKQPDLVDSIKEYQGGGWADGLVRGTIIREEVDPLLLESEKSNKEPDWNRMQQQLSKKYNKDLAITYVLDTRVEWYEKKEDWASFLKYVAPHIARHDINKMNSLGHINSYVWYVYQHSEDPALMKKALGWIDKALGRWGKQATLADAPMDTKACLLYKMGRRKEAIDLVKKIIDMFPEFKNNFQPRLERMVRGEEIWLTMGY